MNIEKNSKNISNFSFSDDLYNNNNNKENEKNKFMINLIVEWNESLQNSFHLLYSLASTLTFHSNFEFILQKLYKNFESFEIVIGKLDNYLKKLQLKITKIKFEVDNNNNINNSCRKLLDEYKIIQILLKNFKEEFEFKKYLILQITFTSSNSFISMIAINFFSQPFIFTQNFDKLL
eukprot:TRINITY_DN4153_c0_g1_i2.p1 TRINITY_DN4153_c0_g1~~TRINITY_DN4153_c0_g1_i2.p1  ORF type:complete len:177 (-),score=55.68 TRINITY_DN4153_c0_g1_i2:1-531(-)